MEPTTGMETQRFERSKAILSAAVSMMRSSVGKPKAQRACLLLLAMLACIVVLSPHLHMVEAQAALALSDSLQGVALDELDPFTVLELTHPEQELTVAEVEAVAAALSTAQTEAELQTEEMLSAAQIEAEKQAGTEAQIEATPQVLSVAEAIPEAPPPPASAKRTQVLPLGTKIALTDDERLLLGSIIMRECGSEPYEGILAVTECFYNAMLRDGLDIEGTAIQYRYTTERRTPSEAVMSAIAQVFDSGEMYINDPYMYWFYAPKYSKGEWHETMRFIIAIGGHRFFGLW